MLKRLLILALLGLAGLTLSGCAVIAAPSHPEAMLTTGSLLFSDITVNNTAPAQIITLSNPGTGPLSISGISITGANAAAFAETTTCGATLAANATCTISVTFSPSSAATFTAAIFVSDNAAGASQTTILLAGMGTLPPVPSALLTTSNLALPITTVNATSAAQTITLTNQGTAPLTITGITIAGTNPADFTQTNTCRAMLAMNATCTISVTFTPQSAASFTAALSIANNAAGSPLTVTLTGTGAVASTPVAVLTPSTLALPNVTVDTTSTSQIITLSNTGSGPLGIGGISVAGANVNDFAQNNNCGPTLLPNASCLISVTFTPQSAATFSATISVADNAGGSPQAATITGTGVTQVLAPIPLSFYGFTVNTGCDISNQRPTNSTLTCSNSEPHHAPGFPLTWSRSVGSSTLRWSDMVQCDPTGSKCPLPGYGCDKNGIGANGIACPRTRLVLGCQPNLKLPTDPANCAYYWTQFDFFTQIYNANNVDWMYGLNTTPDYLSIEGSRCVVAGVGNQGPDPTCAYSADNNCGESVADGDGGCEQPYDLDSSPGNGDGLGTDQNLINFLTAFMTHLAINGEHVKYFEIWNEPTNCASWRHVDGAPFCGTASSGALASAADLVKMAADTRTIAHQYDPKVLIVSPPTPDGVASYSYMQTILQAGSAPFDLIGFHGYDIVPIGNYRPGACPSLCPVPEYVVSEWNAMQSALSALGLSSMQTIDTEFSWGETQNVTNPDMRVAQTARLYLLKESYYPVLQRVDWYGEDFSINLTPNPNNPGGPYSGYWPYGGAGELWASGSTNVADGCVVSDPVQGGFDCPAGLVMKQVADWTVGASFSGPCACSASSNGGSCTATPPTGVWQCAITKPGGYKGLFVWDSTYVTYPCPTSPATATAPCGTGSFAVPSAYSSDWQDLNGNVNLLKGATTVTIGAKPILLENEVFP